MNIILLFEEDFIAPDRVILNGRRVEHICKVHRARIDDTLSVGLLNSHMGTGTVVAMNSTTVELEVILDREPPPPLPLTLVIALPRPKMLRRILQSVASLGVKEIYLINSWRVEKAFWKSPLLEPDRLQNELILGLEQAKDTVMPQIHLKRLFKPFVTEELSRLTAGELPSISTRQHPDPAQKQKKTAQWQGQPDPDHEPEAIPLKEHEAPHYPSKPLAITAHPKGIISCPEHIDQSSILVMGPEGGFIEIEIETLEQAGFTTVTLGKRILRVETAVPFIISKLY